MFFVIINYIMRRSSCFHLVFIDARSRSRSHININSNANIFYIIYFLRETLVLKVACTRTKCVHCVCVPPAGPLFQTVTDDRNGNTFVEHTAHIKRSEHVWKLWYI